MITRSFALCFVTCLATASTARAQEAQPDRLPRLRGGFSGNVGVAFTGESAGPVLGLTARIGAQITPLFGLYYEGTPSLMIMSGSGSGTFDGGMTIFNAAIASFTIGHLELGIGPSADIDMVSTPSSSGSPVFAFGVSAKIALHFGHFTMSLDVHPSLRGATACPDPSCTAPSGLDVLTLTTLTFGGDWGAR